MNYDNHKMSACKGYEGPLHATRHIQQRMSQRGINRDMTNLALEHGVVEQDKYVLGSKEASALLAKMERDMRTLKKIVDKGGIVVVAEGGAMITTYSCTGRRH